MPNMETTLRIGWRSVSIVYASAANYMDIASERRNYWWGQYEASGSVRDHNKWRRWKELFIRAMHAYRYFGNGTDPGGRTIFEYMWECIGNDVGDLPDFYQYEGIPVHGITFNDTLGAARRAELEALYSADDWPLRNPAIRDGRRHERVMNRLIVDIYRIIGTNHWMDTNLDRGTVPGDAEAALAAWDWMTEGARNFFYYGRNCCADTDMAAQETYDDVIITKKRRAKNKAKFINKNENVFTAVRGIWLINPDDLTPLERSTKFEPRSLAPEVEPRPSR